MADPAALPGVFLHPQALCESAAVGEGTRVWAFAHVLPRARIGRDCNICDHVFIENDVILGDRVTVKCGVQLWDGLRVADDVFIGPNATFSNDKYPRSRQHQAQVLQTWIERGASIGAGAVVLPDVRIGARAMVGAGAVVTQDVPAESHRSREPCTDRRVCRCRPAIRPPDRIATPASERHGDSNVCRGCDAPSDAVRAGLARHSRGG